MNWLAFYNATRLHSQPDYVDPIQFEKTALQNRQGALMISSVMRFEGEVDF
jgi:hypothetical protein